MLVPIDRFIGLPILSLQTGSELAKISDAVIDPRRLTIAAFRVTGARLGTKDAFLHPDDIREMTEIGVIVDSNDQLMELDGLVRLQEIVDFGFHLPGIKVQDEFKQNLGAVKSYSLDPASFYIQQLYLKPSFLRSLNLSSLTIHRTQIVSIANDKIVVKAPAVKEESAAKAPIAQPFVNPFTTAGPQVQAESKQL